MNEFDTRKNTLSDQNFEPQQTPTGFETQGPTSGRELQPSDPIKRENVISGIVGAFLGSLIGVVVIVLLDQLGYVAALSGIVMGVCTLKGYELLGGKLSKRGVVISVLIMICKLLQGIFLTKFIWKTVFRYFDTAVDSLNAQGVDITSDFMESLFMQYLFSVLGSASTIITAFRSQK